MLEKIIRGILVIIGIALLYQLTFYGLQYEPIENYLNIDPSSIIPLLISGTGGLIGGVILFFASPRFIRWGKAFAQWTENNFQKIPLIDIIFGFFGILMGLIIANLFSRALITIPFIGGYLPILSNVALGYLGMSIVLKKKDEIVGIIPYISKDDDSKNIKPKTASKETTPKILDTSVIIDGRVADICKAGFLEGKIIIPAFVLDELQHIADSSDLLKRNRGRRGLDILNRIQKELMVHVEIVDKDFEDISEVDSKLVKLAQILGGKVVTNDYNLNKVAELQGVEVLNINELANAVKPVVLPGEEMLVEVIKDGKESGQGVAFLDDGTMIVVDGGKKHIGNNINVLVTSVLQTAAGRMIFAKPKQQHQKAL